MLPISDRTLAELLVERLRARRLYQVFARELDESTVLVSVAGFDAGGVAFRIEERAQSFERAFLAVLRTADARSRQQTRKPAALAPSKRARRARPETNEAETSDAETNDAEIVERTRSGYRRGHLKRVAIERATRCGSVTESSLARSLGGELIGDSKQSRRVRDRKQRLRSVLDELVDEGKLERSERCGYVLASPDNEEAKIVDVAQVGASEASTSAE